MGCIYTFSFFYAVLMFPRPVLGKGLLVLLEEVTGLLPLINITREMCSLGYVTVPSPQPWWRLWKEPFWLLCLEILNIVFLG